MENVVESAEGTESGALLKVRIREKSSLNLVKR
jgi:hypothetical protein